LKISNFDQNVFKALYYGVIVLAGVRVLSLSLLFLGDGTGGSGDGVRAAIVVCEEAKRTLTPARTITP
jgi:hypothetical protein